MTSLRASWRRATPAGIADVTIGFAGVAAVQAAGLRLPWRGGEDDVVRVTRSCAWPESAAGDAGWRQGPGADVMSGTRYWEYTCPQCGSRKPAETFDMPQWGFVEVTCSCGWMGVVRYRDIGRREKEEPEVKLEAVETSWLPRLDSLWQLVRKLLS